MIPWQLDPRFKQCCLHWWNRMYPTNCLLVHQEYCIAVKPKMDNKEFNLSIASLLLWFTETLRLSYKHKKWFLRNHTLSNFDVVPSQIPQKTDMRESIDCMGKTVYVYSKNMDIANSPIKQRFFESPVICKTNLYKSLQL